MLRVLLLITKLLWIRQSFSHQISIFEEKELFQQGIYESVSQSSIPNLISLTFQHQHIFRPYSFNEWDWLSFHRLLRSSINLCRENQTFSSLWTLPIKCEYYQVIRALRSAKDREKHLNSMENRIVDQYVDNIYGKKEDYDKLRKKLGHSLLEKREKKELFSLKTVLESNGVLQLLESNFIASEEILESCAKTILEESSEGLSIAFLFHLPRSYFEKIYSNDKVVSIDGASMTSSFHHLSDLPLFQSFVKSFLRFQQLQDIVVGSLKLSFALYIGYDTFIAQQYPSEFITLFWDLCRALLPFFKKIEMVGLGQELQASYDHSSSDFYNYQRVIDQGHSSLYFFPQVFQSLILASRQSEADYFFLIKDSFSVGDASFFGKSLDSLRFRNHLIPNFGLSLDLHRSANDLLIFHKDMFAMIESFPLSMNVLNNSYLNDENEDFTWNHMYFTLVDIFSVFQPSLRLENEFILSNGVNYSLVANFKDRNKKYFNAQFAVSIERYRVLVERARRHLAKRLHSSDNYLSYHTCINGEVTRLKSGLEKERFLHPRQFCWRPNQLLYEIHGLFSALSF